MGTSSFLLMFYYLSSLDECRSWILRLEDHAVFDRNYNFWMTNPHRQSSKMSEVLQFGSIIDKYPVSLASLAFLYVVKSHLQLVHLTVLCLICVLIIVLDVILWTF